MGPLILLALLAVTPLQESQGQGGIGPGIQEHGFVEVRPGAHVFWWLYHTTANVTASTERPLLIWLAGGPGSSSTGVANFWLVGPVDEDMRHREENWVQHYNILFVDSPVAAGFSYVTDLRLLNKNNSETARDLVEFTKGFYEAVPAFRDVPLYIYGVSYGGKLSIDYALLLNDAISQGNVVCNFKGVAIANPWLSPVDLTLSYSEYLYQTGNVDRIQANLVQDQAEFVKEMFEAGDVYQARVEWDRLIDLVNELVNGGGDNATGAKKRYSLRPKFESREDDLERITRFMNGPVKEALGIPEHVVWASQTLDLVQNLYVDFMMPVTESVENLLNNTNIDLHICNGNLDLLVSTPGTIEWIDKLTWKDSQLYRNAARRTVWVNNTMEGYKQEGGRFHFYWINVAGHIPFVENPAANWAFLKSVTGV